MTIKVADPSACPPTFPVAALANYSDADSAVIPVIWCGYGAQLASTNSDELTAR
jgi:hypothetical protein